MSEEWVQRWFEFNGWKRCPKTRTDAHSDGYEKDGVTVDFCNASLCITMGSVRVEYLLKDIHLEEGGTALVLDGLSVILGTPRCGDCWGPV